MIQYGKQDIGEDDINAVVDVLNSDFLTQGPKVPQFEKALIRKFSCEHAVAVNSATSALHISCLALGLAEGDYLWTSPISFVASANCGLYCGAAIDFVDIDLCTYNICMVSLEEKLQRARVLNKIPKVVVAVHMCGQSCDMIQLRKLSLEYGFYIIEDASHAIGAKYDDEFVGNCLHSDICVFSFHPVKIITTAEGGAATTNSAKLAEKLRMLRSHGIERDPTRFVTNEFGKWHYEQQILGFNYRMSDIQAALGISQLKKVDSFVQKRNKIARLYEKSFQNLPLNLPSVKAEALSSYHLFVIRLQLDELSKSKHEIFNDLHKLGIGVAFHYIPIYRHPYYVKMGFSCDDYPNAEQYFKEALTIPIHVKLTELELNEITHKVSALLSRSL